MKKLRIGLLGFGFIGKTHAYCVRNLPFFYRNTGFTAEIAKVCTAHPSTLEDAVSTIGGDVKGVLDFREITEDPEIDIVDIATPNQAHFSALESAIGAGKHIYCEKPLLHAPEEAIRLAPLLKQYDGISQMTLQYRFCPAVMRAKQIIDSGRLGKILEFRAHFFHAGSTRPDKVIKPWKLEGGVIADLGSHTLDLVRFLLGDFDSLIATKSTAYPTRPDGHGNTVNVPTEDNMQVILRLKNGVDGMVGSSKLTTGAEDRIFIEINGADGALRFDGNDMHRLYFYDNLAADKPVGGFKGWTAIDCGQRFEAPANGFPDSKSALGWLRNHMHCYWSFLQHVNEGTKASPDLWDGLYLQNVLTAVHRAAAEDCRISISPISPIFPVRPITPTK